MRALFLDRDGVINRQLAGYVTTWQEFEVLPGVLAAMQMLARFDGPILVLTNQSAIARRLVTQAGVDEIHRKLLALVTAHGGRIDGFYVCPHHPNDGCACRKPKPGLLLQAAEEHALHLAECIFVGDAFTDYLAARAVGCASILVKTGRAGRELPGLLTTFCAQTGVDLAEEDVLIAPDLTAAAEALQCRGLLTR
jgi:D-glycero-D-manno-heptose 1,7-bisphosphate phosphatase